MTNTHNQIIQQTIKTLTKNNIEIVNINSIYNSTTITFSFPNDIFAYQFLIQTDNKTNQTNIYTFKITDKNNDFIDNPNNTNKIIKKLIKNL